MFKRRSSIYVGIMCAVLLVAFGATTKLSVAAASSSQVSLVNFAFQPQALTVPVGATVVWTNTTTSTNHTVTADDSSFDSGNLSPGTTFKVVFTQPGLYRYHCQYHQSSGMVGSILVASQQIFLPSVFHQ